MLSLLPAAIDLQDGDQARPADSAAPIRPQLRLVPLRTGWCLGLTPGRVVQAPPLHRYQDPERRRQRARRANERRAIAAATRAAVTLRYQSAIPWPVPLSPGAVTATAIDGKVRLSWAAAGGAETYTVRRSASPGGPYEVIGEGVRLTRGTNPTTAPGATYYYVVTARNPAGESPPSREVAVYVPASSEAYEAVLEAPEKESHQEKARRLARLELARLELQRPWGGEPETAISMFAKKKLSLAEIEIGKLLSDDEIPTPSFPSCVEETSPCHFARCRHHLLTDVNRFGSLKISFPGWDVDEVPATCSIREARKGKQTVPQVAGVFNLTTEAVRMIERDAWRKMERLIDPEKLWRGRRRSP